MPDPNWFDDLPRGRCLAEFSMWSADLVNLESELDRVAQYADILHIDVADGIFAPLFLFFPDLVSAIRKRSELPIHVHLMVDDRVLLAQVDQFAEAGSDLISIHAESRQAAEAVAAIRNHGVHAGAVLRFDSPLNIVDAILPDLSMVTLLGTAIGVKGQGLSETTPGRIGAMRRRLAKAALQNRQLVAADGGIRDNTVPRLVASGAQTVVMGSLAFGALDLARRMAWLHDLEMR